MADSDQEELLSILEAHGRQFLNSFGHHAIKSEQRRSAQDDHHRRKRRKKDPNVQFEAEQDEAHSGSEEEWKGFGDVEYVHSNGDEEEEEEESHHVSSKASCSRKPDEVVFCDPTQKSTQSNQMLKAQKKAFMSSRISKVTTDIAGSSQADERNDDDSADDDRTHAQNDAILHRLVHTKLLSGSLNPELNLTHAQREKALAGRVLELSGAASLGSGEKITRKTEHNKASKHVRDGLLRKKKEREKNDLEEAKNLGNYHPALKKVLDPESSKPSRVKRERGLKMGVGKFSGGILKISKKELGAMGSR